MILCMECFQKILMWFNIFLDTFASKTAAIQDETADASVGNVTGSNAVNVFLGIGIAWSMAAIYWEAQGEIHNRVWLRLEKKSAHSTNGEVLNTDQP